MKVLYIFLAVFVNICVAANNDTKMQEAEKKVSEYVLDILEHYKQEDPVGLPGVPIPDPLDIPSLKHSMSIGKIDFNKVKLYGLKKFRINYMTTNLGAMQAEAALTIDVLNVVGNYTLNTWLSKSTGPFTVILKHVYVKANATLEVTRNGTLEAQDIRMDITFKTIDMKFENLPVMAKMVENLVNSMGSFIFDSIKPYILVEVNTNIRKNINENVKNIPQKFPNSISPFDQLVAELRKKVRAMKYDPYHVQDYNTTAGVLTVHLTHTWLTGLSSFYRVGDILFGMKNNTLRADILIGTQRLEGLTHWDAGLIGGVLSKTGIISFTVEYLQVQLVMSQSMDTRKNPQIEDIQIELGNIQIRSDGVGTADYVIELAINVLPNLLRYQIMDALEEPIKKRIQRELDTINVEKIIHDNIDKLDDKNAINNLL